IDHSRSFRDLIQFIDEDRALLRQIVHNIAVMHNLLAYIDRRAKRLQRDPYHVDRAYNSSAEAAWLEKEDSFSFRFVAAFDRRGMVKCGCRHTHKYTASRLRLE